MEPPAPTPPRQEADRSLTIVLVVSPRLLRSALVFLVVCGLCAFVVRTYALAYDPVYGWTKMIVFGQDFADRTLPRLQRLTHYTETSEGGHGGYDGQFYAQLALDVSLRDPEFARSLDMPAYRARRIGLPATAFVLGGFKPRRVLQAYALGNLFFWFVLLGALYRLLRPRTVRALLCLCGGCLCSGAIASMERSLVDLPTTALLVAGLAAGSLGGYALLAAAALTRETSVLAAAGFWDGRLPWREGGSWKRGLAVLAAAAVPLAAWLLYVNFRLGHDTQAGVGNFALPLYAMGARLVEQCHRLAAIGGGNFFHHFFRGDWLYTHYATFELLTILTTFFQGLFLVLRRDWRSPFWRVGASYLLLGSVLGPAVWDDTSAAARVLLPMTVCFYLQLARERGRGWFWTFLVLGSLSVPFAVHDFWQGI